MAGLRTMLEIYRPKFDADKWLENAAEDSAKFVEEHRDEFVPIGND